MFTSFPRLILSAVILACMARVPMQANDWSDVVKQVEKSVVFVEVGDEGSCTGFVIDQARHYVMTAAHCQSHDTLWIDRVPATVVSRDTKKDLLVVEAAHLDPSRPALHLAAKNPVRGSEVMSVGFGYGLERPFFRQSHVQDDQVMISGNGPYISTDSTFVPGQSGGPVVNAAGEIVAIVQAGDNGSTGIGVGAEIIRERMGRFFGK